MPPSWTSARTSGGAPVEPQRRERNEPDFALTVVSHPGVAEAACADAARAVRHVARFAPLPVLGARLCLEQSHNPSVARPAVVSASLELRGRVVRAHAAAATFSDAVDLLERRLRRRVEGVGERAGARRHGR